MTLRELVRMAEARSHDNWNHTSALLAMLANVHRDPRKGRAFKPGDFNPYTQRTKDTGPPLTAEVSLLKKLFVPENPSATGAT